MLAVPLAAAALATAPCKLATAKAVVESTRLTIPGSQSISGEAYRIRTWHDSTYQE